MAKAKYEVLKPIGIKGVHYMPKANAKAEPVIVEIDPAEYGDTLDGHIKEGYFKPLKDGDVAAKPKPKTKTPKAKAAVAPKAEATVAEVPKVEAPAVAEPATPAKAR